VVTGTFALDGIGGVTEYAGGCDQWLSDREYAKNMGNSKKPKAVPVKKKSKKLSNKDKEALVEIPKQIEKMEAERDQITAAMQNPDYYRNPKNDPSGDQANLEKLEVQIASSYSRWEELEAIAE
jgi:ATP-binding cassette subfamily F protein uup